LVGPEAAPAVHALTQVAFAGYQTLTPPSGAMKETEAMVRDELFAHGGGLASRLSVPLGALRFRIDEDGRAFIRRVAVHPDWQHKGIGRRLMYWGERDLARREFKEVRVGVRKELPDNLAFYRLLGYRDLVDHGYWVELGKPL
jgi:ribosomal protein S18 acetylase RimI-like enzyme